MTAALMEVPAPSGPARVVTPDEVTLIKATVAAGATDAELKLFLFDCQRQGVHPLDRLLHFTKRGGKYTPITSIDFMRTRAAETNEYAGSDAPLFAASGGVWSSMAAEGTPVAAMVTVWRLVQGHRCKFEAVARWDEYKPDQNDFLWKKMPHTMLGKCAEALALRKGFPRQLAGLYAREELDQADHNTTVTGEVTPPAPDPSAEWLLKITEATTREALEAVGRELRTATLPALLLKTLRASYQVRLAALKTTRDPGQEG
jgi:phage recombination protein Bet